LYENDEKNLSNKSPTEGWYRLMRKRSHEGFTTMAPAVFPTRARHPRRAVWH